MLCHSELKENYFSGFCWNMDDRNEVSEFSYLEFDMMLTFVAAVESCVTILVTPAGQRKQ